MWDGLGPDKMRDNMVNWQKMQIKESYQEMFNRGFGMRLLIGALKGQCKRNISG